MILWRLSSVAKQHGACPINAGISGLSLTQPELADFFGMNRSSISTWDKNGYPCTGKGKANHYNSKEVVAWYLEHRGGKSANSEMDELKLEKLRPRAALLQIDIDKKSRA